MNCILDKSPRPLRLAAALLLALAGLPAANASLVSTRAGLGGTDTIAWGQLGADLASVAAPAAVTSNGGATASVSNTGGGMTRFDEGGAAFAGNFAAGDQLLTNFFAAGGITIDFTAPVAKVGAQIMAFDYGAFTGVIQVYDAANILLETYDLLGLSSSAKDNSALFLGISRSTADIDHVTFLVSGTDQGNLDFALNQLDFSITGDVVGTVPEPSTLLLAGAALLGMYRRRAS